MMYRSHRLAVLALAVAAFAATALPAPAPAAVFRVTNGGVDNQLDAGFGTLVWRHDADLVKYVDTPTRDYVTLAPGFNATVESSAQIGPTLYFSNQHTLWRSDGTLNSAVEVATIEPTSYEHTVTGLTDLNGTLFFRGYTLETRFEPWVSSGIASGTRIVKDIYPGPTSGMGGWVAVLGGYAYFNGDDGTNGIELWRSNGQEAGTSLVRDISAAPGASSSPDSLTTCGPFIYFSADDGSGRTLWRTDGTAGGTLPVTAGLEPNGYNLTCAGTKLFFDGYSAANARKELWVYDPVDGARFLKADWGCTWCGPRIHTFRAVNGLLLFAAEDAAHGAELWRSDGTPEGTVLVKDIWPGLNYSAGTPFPHSSDPYDMAEKDGKLYFRARHPDYGGEVWVSDGTAANTWPVTDILPGPGNSWPDELTSAGRFLFFRVTGDDSYNVWGFDPADTPPHRDLVRNGSFESASTTTSWTRLGLAAQDARVCNQRLLERCSFRIGGSRTAAKGLRQTIPRSGTLGDAGETIVLSGWSTAKSASATGGVYGLELLVTYRDGSTARRAVAFSRGTHPWQYKRIQFKAARAWSRVTVAARYQNLLGTAWFDDLRLTVR